MKNKYHNEIEGNFYRIYINNTLHVMFKTDEFVGIQSYVNADDSYAIEVYLKERKITLEYDRIDKWKEILRLFNEIQ